jgi:hypothetical protein
LFRWSVIKDPDTTNWCSFDASNNITWSGCLWNIEYLKLEWEDRWMDHNLSIVDSTQWDWVVDTWVINKDFTWWASIVAWTTNTPWVPLFPSSINVSEFKIYAYPNKDIWYDWKNDTAWSNIAPYLILKLKLMPSWKSRKQVWWAWKELDFSMTISLSDIYSK